MRDFKLGDKITITRGRLKGEKGVIIGTTNLNMWFRYIVRRKNKKARDKIMGFTRKELRLI